MVETLSARLIRAADGMSTSYNWTAVGLMREAARELDRLEAKSVLSPDGEAGWRDIADLPKKPAECSKKCPPRQVCDFCQRELFLGWNGDYVELWNTTNYYTCRERSEPHWKHLAEEAARLTHFMAFDMPDRACSILEPGQDAKL